MILDLGGATPSGRHRRSANQPDRAVAHLDRERLQRPSAGCRLHGARQRLERALRTPCHGHCRHPSSVTRPLPSWANRWRQRLETANGLPALIPTARAPCGVVSTTTTCDAPRSSTATNRAVDCSNVVTGPLSHTNECARPGRPDHNGRHVQRIARARTATAARGSTRTSSRTATARRSYRSAPWSRTPGTNIRHRPAVGLDVDDTTRPGLNRRGSLGHHTPRSRAFQRHPEAVACGVSASSWDTRGRRGARRR